MACAAAGAVMGMRRRRGGGGSKTAAAATAAVVLGLLACFCGGAVAARVGCRSNADCEARHFCHLPDATCAPPGMCEPMPEICTMEYMPVCGCDGKTYGNRCGAFGAGVSYRFVGECEHPPGEEAAGQRPPPLPADVSGPAQQQKAAAAAQEGGRRRQLGWTDVFAASAEFLSLRRRPAEGEGDKAAVSGTAGAAVGVGAATAMEGETTRVRCGSRGLAQCDEGHFCEFVDGLCGETDTGGYCSIPPRGCPKIYRPVCGCDSITYSNACVARSQRVSIRHEGDCATQDGPIPTPVAGAGGSAGPQQEQQEQQEQEGQHRPAMCGGLMGKGCPAGQHCIYAVEASCGAADQTGVCMAPPVFCAMSYQPVCGCDGNTYSNTCHAHAQGVSVVAEGACGAPHTPEEADQQEMSKKDQMLASLRLHGPEEVGDAGDNGGL